MSVSKREKDEVDEWADGEDFGRESEDNYLFIYFIRGHWPGGFSRKGEGNLILKNTSAHSAWNSKYFRD